MASLAMMEPVARPMSGKGFSRSSNETLPENVQRVISRLLVRNSQQHRNAIIVATSFSIAASLLVIYSILRDAYRVKEGEAYSTAQKRIGFLRVLHPAEVFPFITAIAIVIQGFIFIGVQASAMKTFWSMGCALTAQLIWPTVWLVPVTILVFSMEVTFRSLLKKRFRARGKWETPICIIAVVLIMLALWLTAFLMPALNMCPGSLVWWTLHWSRLGVIFGPGIIFTHFLSGAIISLQLWRTVKMDRDERIAASRVVYSLGINVLVITFLLPFWIERLMGEFPQRTSRIADIAITLSGIAHSSLYVFLRANAERLAIRPKDAPWSDKRRMRLFGPNDLNVNNFISTPLLARPQESKDWPEWQNDKNKMKYPAQLLPNSTNPRPSPSPRFQPRSPRTPMSPPATQDVEKALEVTQPDLTAPAKIAEPQYQRKRSKSSYSIFPTAASTRPGLSSWISNRSSGSNEPLPMPLPLFLRKHSRNDSTATSATIDIGMRLSSMQDMQARPSISMELHRQADMGDHRRAPSNPYQQRESSLRPPRTSSRPRWQKRVSFSVAEQQRKRQMMKSLPPTPGVDEMRVSRMPPPPLALTGNPTRDEEVSPTSVTTSGASFHSPGYSPPPRYTPLTAGGKAGVASPQRSPWPLPAQPVRPAEAWI